MQTIVKILNFQSLAGLTGEEKDESEMTDAEKKEVQKKRYTVHSYCVMDHMCKYSPRQAARKMSDKGRREKHKQMEEDREKVRQQLREKVVPMKVKDWMEFETFF